MNFGNLNLGELENLPKNYRSYSEVIDFNNQFFQFLSGEFSNEAYQKLYKEKNSYLILLLSLLIFSPISRFPVAVLWWIDTRWKIGTHYSLYFDNFAQATFQQVVYGSLIQLIPGFLLGAITIAIMRNKKNVKKKINTIENE